MLTRGIATSEFWLTVMYALIIVLNGTEWVNIPGQEMIALAGVMGVGIGGRQILKSSELKASAGISALAQKIEEKLRQ